MKNTYFSTAIGLYLNYLVHGMGVILMSLNMSSLEQQWQTNTAGVSIVISSLGIGRLSVLLVAGMLSDRYGRRPFIILGMTCYLIFFIGIINTHSIFLAYAFGFLAGMANSFLDAGTYPSLMEAFPRSPSTANILIKAFVSSGQFLLPMIISLLVWAEIWFGWSFLLAAAVMILNGVFLFRCRFPPHPGPHTVIRAQPAERETGQPEHRCSLLDLASYTPVRLHRNGDILPGKPVAGAIRTVCRRNALYVIYQTVKHLYLRLSTVRADHRPAGAKSRTRDIDADAVYVYLICRTADDLSASDTYRCHYLCVCHRFFFRRGRCANRFNADGRTLSACEGQSDRYLLQRGQHCDLHHSIDNSKTL